MRQSLAVTTPDRTFILELLPLGHNIVTISYVMCVILLVMLQLSGKAACWHVFLVYFQEMIR